MPRCPSCGQENLPGTPRCRKCLTRLPASAEPPQGATAPTGPKPGGELEPAVLEAVLGDLRKQQKIGAIKRYREATGTGLKEAKEAVEAIAAAHGVESRGGCSSAAALLVSAVLMVAWSTAGGCGAGGDSASQQVAHPTGAPESPPLDPAARNQSPAIEPITAGATPTSEAAVASGEPDPGVPHGSAPQPAAAPNADAAAPNADATAPNADATAPQSTEEAASPEQPPSEADAPHLATDAAAPPDSATSTDAAAPTDAATSTDAAAPIDPAAPPDSATPNEPAEPTEPAAAGDSPQPRAEPLAAPDAPLPAATELAAPDRATPDPPAPQAPAPEPVDEKPVLQTLVEPLLAQGDGVEALRRYRQWAGEQVPRIQAIDSYTMEFRKRERIDGVLADQEKMFVKVRHHPFSVYLRHFEPDKLAGQEALYVAGKNDNKLIGHGVGLRRFLGTLKLRIDSSLAMDGNRHPITHIGILHMATDSLKNIDRQLELGDLEVAFRFDERVDGRPCTVFEIRRTRPVPGDEFRRDLRYIDNEYLLPVRYTKYGWPTTSGEADPLLEDYQHTKLKLEAGLTDVDFDRANADYNF